MVSKGLYRNEQLSSCSSSAHLTLTHAWCVTVSFSFVTCRTLALERKDFYSKAGKETSPRTLLCCLNQLGVLVGGHCPLLSGCPSPCILGSRHPTSCDGTCSCFQPMKFPLPRMPFMVPSQQENRTISIPILWMRKLRPRKGKHLT